MSYTDRDFDQLKRHFKIRRYTGRSLEMRERRLPDLKSWGNPGSVPSELGPNQPVLDPEALAQAYLARMPREQATVFQALRDTYQKSDLARPLLGLADSGHVRMVFTDDPQSGNVASYAYWLRDIGFNASGSLMKAPNAERFMATIGLYGAHELVHAVQDYALGRGDMGVDSSSALSSRILAVRHMEAAAVAGSVQIAYDLAVAGDESLWNLAMDGRSKDIELPAAEAFAGAVLNNPKTAKNGEARRAAHDAWFRQTNYMAQYDRATLGEFRNMLEMIAQDQARGYKDPAIYQMSRDVGADIVGMSVIHAYTAMPVEVEHMNLPGYPDIDDKRYRRGTTRLIYDQAMHLEEIARKLRDDEEVFAADFEAYDALSKQPLQPPAKGVAERRVPTFDYAASAPSTADSADYSGNHPGKHPDGQIGNTGAVSMLQRWRQGVKQAPAKSGVGDGPAASRL